MKLAENFKSAYKKIFKRARAATRTKELFIGRLNDLGFILARTPDSKPVFIRIDSIKMLRIIFSPNGAISALEIYTTSQTIGNPNFLINPEDL